MGKGDKRTKRGKITIGSYGNSRPHKVATPEATAPVAAKAAKPAAKAAAPKAEKKKKA